MTWTSTSLHSYGSLVRDEEEEFCSLPHAASSTKAMEDAHFMTNPLSNYRTSRSAPIGHLSTAA
jgi:hypothetical protein